jgi:hypothetical protein
MKADGRIGIAEVRASQNLAKASIPLLMRYLFVPASWPLTVAAARAGFSPNGATFARALLSATGLAILAYPTGGTLAVGIVLVILSKIADSVDGNLARLGDRASYFGKYADGLIDMVEDLAFPLALAIHLWLTGSGAEGVVLSGAVAIFSLAVVFLAIYRLPMFELILEKEKGSNACEAARLAHPGWRDFFASRFGKAILFCDAHGVNAAYDARFAGLVAGLALGALDVYLTCLAALYAAGACFFLFVRLARGFPALDVHRRSRSAA